MNFFPECLRVLCKRLFHNKSVRNKRLDPLVFDTSWKKQTGLFSQSVYNLDRGHGDQRHSTGCRDSTYDTESSLASKGHHTIADIRLVFVGERYTFFRQLTFHNAVVNWILFIVLLAEYIIVFNKKVEI